MAIEVTHPLENQMYTARPVADRVNGTAIRLSITDGEHTLVEEGAPTQSIVQQNARLDIALAALDAANARLAALEANAGMPVSASPTTSGAVAGSTSAASIEASAPVATDPTVADLEAQLAAAKAKLSSSPTADNVSGTDTYVAPTAA